MKKKVNISGSSNLSFLEDFVLFKPFSPDGTLKCRFEKFLIFTWKGRPDTYERRDYMRR